MEEGDTSLLSDINEQSSKAWAAALWTALHDPLTGEDAFVCPSTGETAWSVPPGTLVLPSGREQWWELLDPISLTPYFFNTRSRRTTWTRPTQTLVIPLQAVQQTSLGKRLSLVVEHASLPSLIEDADEADSTHESFTTPLTTPQRSPVRSKPRIRIEGIPEVTTEAIHIERLSRATTTGAPRSSPAYRLERPIVRQRAATAPASPAQTRLPLPPSHRPAPTWAADLSNLIFAERRAGLLRKRVKLEEIFTYQKTKLDKPLLELAKPLRSLALQAFEHVLAITTNSDMASACIWTRPILEEARALTALALTHPGIQDEVYLQCLKQLNGVETRPDALRGWSLMQCLLGCFPPGRALQGYLDRYFASAELVAVDRIDTIAKFCRRQLSLIMERGARTRIPLPLKEIEAASKGAFLQRLFGESLRQITKRERADDKTVTIPIILPFLCHLLEKANAKQAEGIFRVPGDANAVIEARYQYSCVFLANSAQLRVRLDCSNYATRLDDGEDADAFTIASLLKLFLRELREPLIITSSYEQCVRSTNVEECVEALKTLPGCHRRSLVFLIKYLQHYLTPSVQAHTKMSLASLAMCALIHRPDVMHVDGAQVLRPLHIQDVAFVSVDSTRVCQVRRDLCSHSKCFSPADRLENRFIERLLLIEPSLLDEAAVRLNSKRKRGSVPNLAAAVDDATAPRRRLASMPATRERSSSLRNRGQSH